MILLDIFLLPIIIAKSLRWCWNWQTGMVEGHVPQGVGVQLPPSALSQYQRIGFFFIKI